MADDFSAVNLLTPVDVENGRRRRFSFVSSTMWPSNRVREHNGCRDHGANFTDDRRPWEMVCVVQGFASWKEALL
jgi:predicted GIY-YIG superfamily endonuclease